MHRTRTYQRLMSRRSLIAGAVGTLGVVGAGSIPALCAGKIYPGTHVKGIDVAGMFRDDAEMVLRANLIQVEAHPLVLEFEGTVWQPSLADLGMSIDYETILDQAMDEGRKDGLVDRYTSYLSRDPSRRVELAFQQNTARLASYLDLVGREIDITPQNARLVRVDAEIGIEGEVAGRALDRDHALDATLELVLTGRGGTVSLRTTSVSPAVTATDLKGARDDAWQLVSEPIVFMHEDMTYPVGSDVLTSALKIGSDNTASLDIGKLQERMQQISRGVATPARNVRLGWNDGLYVVESDVDGVDADVESMAGAILNVAPTSDRTVELPVRRARAAARADNIKELGITGHLGAGSSSFAGSSLARAANVGVSADNISFKLVAPGASFSFNTLLGPITEEYGYIAGTIIQGDWVASDIGGGVCQVSTTVFRAAVNAGFRFSEWNPHSWRLAFYEADGSSPGLDAAIYQPNTEWEMEQDLTFVNPLDSWLLLGMVIDGDTVSAHFYGKDPGWTVELYPARISEPKPVGDPIERINETLAPGERRMVQQSQPGYTVAIRRTITDSDGTVTADGDFVSDYLSQPEAWEVGPA